MSKARVWMHAVFAVLLLWAPAAATAQINPPPTYAGDLWSRPRLTGDWFGGRDWLAEHGATFDVDMVQILQGVGSGGLRNNVSYDGLVDYDLKADTGKMGLWPGGFFELKVFTTYGTNSTRDSGALFPPNAISLLPEPGDNTTTALMNLTFAQFLAPWVGVFAGKVYTIPGDANDFAHSERTQFMNVALNIDMALALAPYTAYGGGFIFLPWKGATFTVSVIDPDGEGTQNDITKAFENGVAVGAEGRVEIKPFGLVGHQDLGFFWSNKTRFSLNQDPANIVRLLVTRRFPRLQDPGPILRRLLERFAPELLVPVKPANTEGSTWTIYYNFDQYLWSPKGSPDKGVGIFFRFGVSDGNPNPVKYAYNVGLSANGVVPGRPNDNMGVGWARTQVSSDFVPFLRSRFDLGLSKEDAVEMYYNVVVTPWLNVSADLQVIDSALNKFISNGRLVNVDTAVLGALRMYVRF
jgi:porin